MLTAAEVAGRRARRRAPISLQQQYQQYIMQRIEAYKHSLSRSELMTLAAESTAEMVASLEGQLVLTEVLVLESVDRLIAKRLKLPSYKRWRTHFQSIRESQREPTRWGMSAHHPVSRLLPRLEPGDRAVLVGTGCGAAACLLAAHDVEVTFLADDLSRVEALELQLASEALGASVECYVALFGNGWLPTLDGPAHLVVIDADALRALTPPEREWLVSALQSATAGGGAHAILAGDSSPASTLLAHYDGWMREHQSARRRSTVGSNDLLLEKPCQSDDTSNESDGHRLMDARD
ncbi:MAG TPA: hypothetical protein VFI13_09850 [Gemmatimonadales bacterium]|nr:hypothetical protein [Gemmatimonadales bacterium]